MAKKLPPEDELLWNNFTKDIRPLKKSTVNPSLDFSKKVYIRPSLSQEPKVNRFQKVEELHPNDLRKVSIDAYFDLHGFTQVIGKNALKEFLKNAAYKEWRWVCVITGKGSINNPSVLREQTPKWLQAMPEFVTGYAQAKPEDGGAGAFYVKIRRRYKL